MWLPCSGFTGNIFVYNLLLFIYVFYLKKPTALMWRFWIFFVNSQVRSFDKKKKNVILSHFFGTPCLFFFLPASFAPHSFFLNSSHQMQFSTMLVAISPPLNLALNYWNPLSKTVIEEFCVESHLKNVRNNPLPCLPGILRVAS